MKRLLEKVDFKTDNVDAGNEYDKSLRAQAELEFYVAAYTDAVADRREILTEGVGTAVHCGRCPPNRLLAHRRLSSGRLSGRRARNAKLKQRCQWL